MTTKRPFTSPNGFADAAGKTTKIWTAISATGTYTVPAGVTSIRVYAFGGGGNRGSNRGGDGGGCAYHLEQIFLISLRLD